MACLCTHILSTCILPEIIVNAAATWSRTLCIDHGRPLLLNCLRKRYAYYIYCYMFHIHNTYVYVIGNRAPVPKHGVDWQQVWATLFRNPRFEKRSVILEVKKYRVIKMASVQSAEPENEAQKLNVGRSCLRQSIFEAIIYWKHDFSTIVTA